MDLKQERDKSETGVIFQKDMLAGIQTSPPPVPEPNISKSMLPVKGEPVDTQKETVPHPKRTSLYLSIGYYTETLQIRVQRGEDEKMVALLNRVMLRDRDLDKNEYIDLVSLLFHSYPLLLYNHATVFEALRQVGIKYLHKDYETFCKCAQTVTNYLSPCSSEQAEVNKIMSVYTNPIPILEIIHTLHVWGDTSPFREVFSHKQRLDFLSN